MKYEITDDHIGIFDCEDFEEYSNKCLRFFEKVKKNNLAHLRSNQSHEIKDEAFDLITTGFHNASYKLNYLSSEFINIFFSKCYNLYVEKYSILNDFQKHTIFDIKIQKTEKGEGYHVWHTENTAMINRDRICAFMLYLNDVKKGGETEFLYQSRRIKPKKNRLIIWPAGFTHTHRGNPPLSNTKYAITGWVEYGE
jgi:hypothetical protein